METLAIRTDATPLPGLQNRTRKRKRKAIRAKYGPEWAINSARGRWKTRKFDEEAASKLQEARNNMRPKWDYRSKILRKPAQNVAIQKKDAAECQGVGEAVKR